MIDSRTDPPADPVSFVRQPIGTSGICAVAACLCLSAGCATANEPQAALDAELDRLTTLLIGDYFSAADAGARQGRPIYMRVRAIRPPAGHEHALYAEMRHDGPAGELYRQRVYLFDERPERPVNSMTALGVTNASTAAGLIGDAAGLARGDVKTTEVLNDGCDMVWSSDGDAFVGRIDPDRCVIVGKRGNRVHIEGVTRIAQDSIGQLERGFSLDGELLFGNPGDSLYVWPRVETADTID